MGLAQRVIFERIRISCSVRLRLKCGGTRAETRFRLSAKRTSTLKWAWGVSSVDYWQASCAHQPAGFVLLVRACVLQSCDAQWLPTFLFPLHFSSRASPRAITFQLDSTLYNTPYPFIMTAGNTRHLYSIQFNWTIKRPRKKIGLQENSMLRYY